ncbi:MAG: SRPBCC family protein [Chloroflexi bacterium]|nr:SRPBCC family protein [Chloroflexota bacterium]
MKERRRRRRKLLPAGGLLALGLGTFWFYQRQAMPWMRRWGASDEELQAVLPGDELIPGPELTTTRAVTIQAPAEKIWPWLVQMGADRGGMYSYTWLEALLNCPQVNADRIHPEWQDLQVGDQVRLCMGEMPPPYTVVAIEPGCALVLAHPALTEEDRQFGPWCDTWAFVLQPADSGATRLIVRSRTARAVSWLRWIEAGVFVMERGMLLGIRDRAEGRIRAS